MMALKNKTSNDNLDIDIPSELIESADNLGYSIIKKLGLDNCDESENNKLLAEDFIRNLSKDIKNNIISNVLLLLSDIKFNVLDMAGNKHNIKLNSDILLEYVLNKAYENETPCKFEDILLDRRYLVYDDKIYTSFNEDVAYYIQNYCPMKHLIKVINGDIYENRIMCCIDTYRKYIKTAARINDIKYVTIEPQPANISSEDFEMKYINETLCNKLKVNDLLKKIPKPTLDKLNDIAQQSNIYALDFIYRVYNGMKIKKAVEIGLSERDKYRLEFIQREEPGDMRTAINWKAAEILERLIKEEIENIRLNGEAQNEQQCEG